MQAPATHMRTLYPPTRRGVLHATLSALVAAGALAGCSAGADSTDGTDGTDDAPTAATEDEATGTAEDAGGDDASSSATVALAETSLGEVLVDADGMTLYLFDPDEQGASTCYDACATAWPPVLAEGEPVAGDGLDAALLGTVERTDGSTQVTYDSWPLYLFAQDAAAGDVAGQGANGVWWVLDATGAPVRD